MRTIYWDPNNAPSVESARAQYTALIQADKDGHVHWKALRSQRETWTDPKAPGSEPVDRPSGVAELGSTMDPFDPAAGCAIFMPILPPG